MSYTLDSGVAAHDEFPDTFHLPSERDRQTLGRGDLAKLIFRFSLGDRQLVERMWVRVQDVGPEGMLAFSTTTRAALMSFERARALNSTQAMLFRFDGTLPEEAATKSTPQASRPMR